MNSRVSMLLIVAFALVSSSGCASQQKKVEAQLANPAAINCATAQGD